MENPFVKQDLAFIQNVKTEIKILSQQSNSNLKISSQVSTPRSSLPFRKHNNDKREDSNIKNPFKQFDVLEPIKEEV